MRKIALTILSVTLTAALLLCALPASLAEEAATAQTTMPPAAVAGSVEGTVLDVQANDIIINMANGNTIHFMMNYISETDAEVGDKVKIEYAGDVTDRPEAVTITITEKSPAMTLNGTVVLHDSASVFVQISSQEAFGFAIDKNTVITGEADHLITGDTVALTYSGDLHDQPVAVEIEITKAVKNRTETKTEDTTNKTLDGAVTKVTGNRLTIRTGRKKTYSFQIASSTKITGKYTLETGARVTVTYDGYASKTPVAKSIRVIAPPDPNPTPTPKPSTRTTTGYVSSFGGMYLSLDNGMGFDCTYAKYSGNGDGEPGEQARVTYYVGDDGMNYATYVVFTKDMPGPTPAPSTRTTSGIVESFGGMYLSLDNGMGFDCTYAKYSGNGNREPGEQAKVTYYVADDGMNYATHITFTAVIYTTQEPVPDPDPDPDPNPDPVIFGEAEASSEAQPAPRA